MNKTTSCDAVSFNRKTKPKTTENSFEKQKKHRYANSSAFYNTKINKHISDRL